MDQDVFSLCLFKGLIEETGIPRKLVSQSVLGARQPQEVHREGFMSVIVTAEKSTCEDLLCELKALFVV
jgi:hypothetical protein